MSNVEYSFSKRQLQFINDSPKRRLKALRGLERFESDMTGSF